MKSFKSILKTYLSEKTPDELGTLLNQRNLGQSLTPDNLSLFIAEFGKQYNPGSIIDLACGYGSMLFYSDYCKDRTGIEINYSVAEIAKKISPVIDIINANSLYYNFKRKYDLVISHPPFGLQIIKDERRIIADQLFIEKALEILDDNGVMIFIVSNSVLSMNSFKELRDKILKTYSLEAVISLPRDMFADYSMIKSSILIIKKAKQRDKVYLGDYSDRHNIIFNYQNEAGTFWIKSSDLDDRWDIEYHDPKYQEMDKHIDNQLSQTLSEMSEIIGGIRPKKEIITQDGDFLILAPKNIKDSITTTDKDIYIHDYDLPANHRSRILRVGDILISRIINVSNFYIYNEDDLPAIAGSNLIIIRSDKSDYLATYLSSEQGKKVLITQLERRKKGSALPTISIADLKNIKIPIIPKTDLNALGNRQIRTSSVRELDSLIKNLTRLKSELEKCEHQETDFESFIEFSDNRLYFISDQINIVTNQLNNFLRTLLIDIHRFKSLSVDEETKIDIIVNRIESKLVLIPSQYQDVEFYNEKIKIWFDYWDELEQASKIFISQAEFLYDELSKISDTDFSPFILQYCRSLENEILVKLFTAYHEFLKQSARNVENLIQNELSNTKTVRFAKNIKKDNRNYTLGDMNWIMGLLKPSGNTFRNSLLLQDFYQFSTEYFQKNVFEKEYLEIIKSIVSDYRNKAAHPNVLDVTIAKNFHSIIKNGLVKLLMYYKKKE